MSSYKITNRVIDLAKPRGREYTLWDKDLKGFGLRVQPGGTRSYVIKYRAGGGRKAPVRRYTIGRHGSPWTPETARRKAKELLLSAATGGDPALERASAKKLMNVAELCELYLREGCVTKKQSTLLVDQGRVRWHIVPLLGKKLVQDVTRADAIFLLDAVAKGKTKNDVMTRAHGRARVTGGKYAANRVVGLFCAIMNFACDRGLIPFNPAQGTKKFPESKRERSLSSYEISKLGTAISQVEKVGANPMAIAIIRILLFTGARRSEIEKLKWSEVDLHSKVLRLADSKTGQKTIPLSDAAAQILEAQLEFKRSFFVFPSISGDTYFQGLSKVWRRIQYCADLEDLRLHDLRHVFASVGISNGVPIAVMARILGHSDTRMTARYAHLADDPVARATETVADLISQDLA